MRIVRARHIVVRHVCAIDDGLVRQKMQFAQDVQDGIALGTRERTHWMSRFQMLQKRRARLRLGPERRLRLRLFLDAVVPLLELFHIGEDKFRLDDFRIPDRVDRRGLVAAFAHVDDVIVLETPHDMQNRVALADVGEELVPEALALRGSFHEAGDIREIHRRADDLLGRNHLCERLQPRIVHFHDRRIRLDRAKRIVLRRRLLLLCQRIEKR